MTITSPSIVSWMTSCDSMRKRSLAKVSSSRARSLTAVRGPGPGWRARLPADLGDQVRHGPDVRSQLERPGRDGAYEPDQSVHLGSSGTRELKDRARGQ